MLEKKLYRHRFDQVKKRKIMWRVLVDHFFQRYIGKNTVVLDLACGYGEFINAVICKSKIGVDINPDTAIYLNKNVRFIKAKSEKIPLSKQSVDVVFISNFFEHISRNDIVKTIKEIRRILKPGGTVLVLQPNIRFLVKDYWMFFDHITPVDDRALIEIFATEGFSCKLNIERFLPYTTKSRLPVSPFFIKLYLLFPVVWRCFGKQSFLIFKK